MTLVAILSFVPAHVFSSPGCQGRCYRHYAIISIFRITYFLSTKYMAANACGLYPARSGSNIPDLRTSDKEIQDPTVERELDDVKTMQQPFCNPTRAYRLIRANVIT